MVGESILVVMSHQDAEHVFNDSASYSTDAMFDTIYRGVANVSEDAHKVLWRRPSEGFVSLHPNPKENVLVHTGNNLLHKQILQSGPRQMLTEQVMCFIERSMRWETFTNSTKLAEMPDTKVVSLHGWCRDVLIGAQSRAFFGDFLFALEPNLPVIFDDWDINSWMMVYQVPGLMARAATKPRDRLIEIFKRYLESPRELRSGGVPFVNELEAEEKHAGLSSEDSARILMIILGVSSASPINTTDSVAHGF